MKSASAQILQFPPLKRTLHVFRVLLADINRCDLFRLSGAMAYTTLLSIVPSLAVLFAILAAFYPILGQKNDLIVQIKSFIFQHLATGSGEVVVNYLEAFVEKINKSRIGVTAFASLLFTLILLLRQIELVLNKIWDIYQERNFFSRFVYFWTFLTLGIFVGGLIFAIVAQFNPNKMIGSNQVVDTIAEIVRYLTYFGGGFIFFFVLYKVVPNTFVSGKQAAIGAAVSSLFFYMASNFYGTFVIKYTSYASIYGTLAALPMFLVWLYILWVIILCGAVISWRVGRGFVLEQKIVVQGSLLTADDPIYAEISVKTALPLMLLLAIFQEFKKGRGATIGTLGEKIKLPKDWLLAGCQTLEKCGWVHQARTLTGALDSAMVDAGNIYYPTIPAQELNLQRLLEKLTVPMQFNFSPFLNVENAAELADSLPQVMQALHQGADKRQLPLSQFI